MKALIQCPVCTQYCNKFIFNFVETYKLRYCLNFVIYFLLYKNDLDLSTSEFSNTLILLYQSKKHKIFCKGIAFRKYNALTDESVVFGNREPCLWHP